jgi:hypothetical protein
MKKIGFFRELTAFATVAGLGLAVWGGKNTPGGYGTQLHI